jgi:cytidyltransferase-like protein
MTAAGNNESICKMKIVLATGGFDPLHSGHIEYFKAAKQLGDILVVGVNSDKWLSRKKGQPFMSWFERQKIVKSLKMVDYTLEFLDDDDTSKQAIKSVRLMWPSDTIIFANGGDRTEQNIPEMHIEDKNVQFAFGVGGTNKINSSSKILQDFKSLSTIRPWGNYTLLYEVPGMKVKELTIEPGKSLSMQRHFNRNEYWQVSEGRCVVETESGLTTLNKHENMIIPLETWHKLYNPFNDICKMIEIQSGLSCVEDDIERK